MDQANKDAEDDKAKDHRYNVKVCTAIHDVAGTLLADVFMFVANAWSAANPLLPLSIRLPTVSLAKRKCATAV